MPPLVDRNLGETRGAHEGNHRQSSSIDTNVVFGEGKCALSALLYTHKIAHKTNEIPRRSDRENEKTWLRRGGKIRHVRLNYLQSNIGSSRRSHQDDPSSQFFEDMGRGAWRASPKLINMAVKQTRVYGCAHQLGGRPRCDPALRWHHPRCAQHRQRVSRLQRSSLLPPSRHVLGIVAVYIVPSSTPWGIHK